MGLDLDELLTDWVCTPGEICARQVAGRDGGEFVQLKVDLGALQMFTAGRPAGGDYQNCASVFDYVRRILRGAQTPAAETWKELERELTHFNYRRLAFSALADQAARQQDWPAAKRDLLRALRDTDACLERIRFLQEHRGTGGETSLRPTLTFNRARLASQLNIVEGLPDEAIEWAEIGAEELETALAEMGAEDEQRGQDPGVLYLRELAQRLRHEHGVKQTLRERLRNAIDSEDYEAAARLHTELGRRQVQRSSYPPPPLMDAPESEELL